MLSRSCVYSACSGGAKQVFSSDRELVDAADAVVRSMGASCNNMAVLDNTRRVGILPESDLRMHPSKLPSTQRLDSLVCLGSLVDVMTGLVGVANFDVVNLSTFAPPKRRSKVRVRSAIDGGVPTATMSRYPVANQFHDIRKFYSEQWFTIPWPRADFCQAEFFCELTVFVGTEAIGSPGSANAAKARIDALKEIVVAQYNTERSKDGYELPQHPADLMRDSRSGAIRRRSGAAVVCRPALCRVLKRINTAGIMCVLEVSGMNDAFHTMQAGALQSGTHDTQQVAKGLKQHIERVFKLGTPGVQVYAGLANDVHAPSGEIECSTPGGQQVCLKNGAIMPDNSTFSAALKRVASANALVSYPVSVSM